MAWPYSWRTPFRPPAHGLRLFALAGLLALGLQSGATAEDYVAVASADAPVNGLSLEELRRIFLFTKRHWSTSRPITIVFSEESLARGSFLTREVYHMDFPEIRRLILEKLYQGELDLAPKVAASDSSAVALVGAGSNLLTLVPASALSTRRAEKVLRIDGRLPGEDGYPLRR